MNATKRKLHTLLQGLANPPLSPYSHTPDVALASGMNNKSDISCGAAASATNHDALLQKRRRLGLPESTAPKDFNAPSVASALTSLASSIRKPSPHGQSSFSPSAARSNRRDALVKYCPGDRDQLLGRLATFQELTDWTPKPDDINEVQWAKRGWICQAKETVRCILCHKELVVKVSRRQGDDEQPTALTPSEIENALVEKYSQLIVSAHQQDCLWRKRGCDDLLLRLSFSNTRATLAALRLRYEELCARASFLPYEFNVRAPEDLVLDQVLSLLPPDFFENPGTAANAHTISATKPVNRSALVLALMGWQGLSNSRIGAVPNSASCHTCHRRLGLWMFKSKEVDDDGSVLVPAPMDHLDPLREHRFFCPWKNAEAQSRGTVGGPGSSATVIPAWAMLLQTLRNEASLRSVYESRSKTSNKSARSGVGPDNPAAPSQSTKPATPATEAATAASRDPEDDEADEKAREAKDKERWARLRKVKSLFDTKGSRILRRSISSRPGTGHSNKS